MSMFDDGNFTLNPVNSLAYSSARLVGAHLFNFLVTVHSTAVSLLIDLKNSAFDTMLETLVVFILNVDTRFLVLYPLWEFNE